MNDFARRFKNFADVFQACDDLHQRYGRSVDSDQRLARQHQRFASLHNL